MSESFLYSGCFTCRSIDVSGLRDHPGGPKVCCTCKTVANWYVVHVRQSGPNSGLGVHVEALESFKVVPSSRGSGPEGR